MTQQLTSSLEYPPLRWYRIWSSFFEFKWHGIDFVKRTSQCYWSMNILHCSLSSTHLMYFKMTFVILEEPTNSLLKARQRKPTRYSTQCKTWHPVSRLKSCYYSRDLHTDHFVDSHDNLLLRNSVGRLPYILQTILWYSFQFAHSIYHTLFR